MTLRAKRSAGTGPMRAHALDRDAFPFTPVRNGIHGLRLAGTTEDGRWLAAPVKNAHRCVATAGLLDRKGHSNRPRMDATTPAHQDIAACALTLPLDPSQERISSGRRLLSPMSPPSGR